MDVHGGWVALTAARIATAARIIATAARIIATAAREYHRGAGLEQPGR